MRTPEEIAKHVMEEARSGRLGDQSPERTEALIASAIAGVIEACAKIAEEQRKASRWFYPEDAIRALAGSGSGVKADRPPPPPPTTIPSGGVPRQDKGRKGY